MERNKTKQHKNLIDTHDRTYDYWWDNGQLYGRRKNTPEKEFRIDSEEAKQKLAPYVTAMGIDTKPTQKQQVVRLFNDRPKMPTVIFGDRSMTKRGTQSDKKNSRLSLTTDNHNAQQVPEEIKRKVRLANEKALDRLKEERAKEKQRKLKSELYTISPQSLDAVTGFFKNISNTASNIDEAISKIDDVKSSANNVVNRVKDNVNDIYNTVKENRNDLGALAQTAWNGVVKHFQEDKVTHSNIQKINKTATKTPPLSKYHTVTETIDPKFAMSSRYGNGTIRWDKNPVDNTGQKYAIEESFPITSNMRWTSRNRGSRDEVNGQRMPITTYRPFNSYEKTNTPAIDGEGHLNYFMGYDKHGSFKLGPKSQFKRGDTMTQVFYDDLTDIPRDTKGNLLFKKFGGDTRRSNVVFNGLGEIKADRNGKPQPRQKRQSSFTMTTGVNNLDTSVFGNVMGGGILVQCGSETRIIRGSTNFCINELEQMLKNHRGKQIRVFLLDNGSYNRGLRVKSKTITPKDWEDYDRQNTTAASGGHGMILLNKK